MLKRFQRPYTPTKEQEIRNREQLITSVRAQWIDGVYNQSMGANPWINVDLVLAPKYVPIPSVSMKWQSEDGSKLLDQDEWIETAFKKYAANALLILGAPGSGKTITLLDLTKELLNEAEKDSAHTTPIPVVFNLSSWALETKSLFNWLVSELGDKYGVSSGLANYWLETNALILMLDGLDEVSSNKRIACVSQINNFRTLYGQTRIVVCSRLHEYQALNQQLNLPGALVLQPLTYTEADNFLAELGQPLEAARTLLKTNKQLQEWAQTPLFLSVITIAYRNLSNQQLENAQINSLFEIYKAYVDRVVNEHRPNKRSNFTPQQLAKWLTWMAQKMSERQQTVFLIEQMQPDWLEPSKESEGVFTATFERLLRWCLGKNKINVNDSSWSWEAAREGWKKSSDLFQVPFPMTNQSIVIFSSLVWLATTIAFGLVFGLANGLIAGFIFGLIVGTGTSLIIKTVNALILGLNYGNIQPHLFPNQGTWNNLKVSLIFGLTLGSVIGILVWSSIVFIPAVIGPNGFSFNPTSDLVIFGLVVALLISSVVSVRSSLSNGLWDFFRHFILRKLLVSRNLLPRNLVAFLDEAAESLLLQKVGGGYIFIHRTLLEYFASLENGAQSAEEGNN